LEIFGRSGRWFFDIPGRDVTLRHGYEPGAGAVDA
jgi:hypothetical protein